MLLELRHALRRLRRSPGFSGVAIASLALGIGANSAIFNLVHAALMETAPVRDLDQLYWLRVNYPDGASARGFSYPFYKQLRQAGAGFQDVICSYPVPLSLSAATAGGSVAERIQGEIVSGNYFQMLGVGAYLGRLIGPADDRTRGGDAVAVLSFDFWKSRFGADPAIVGREIRLNNHRFMVIGISQPGYDGLENGTARKAVFAPMMMKAQLTPGWDALEMVEANWLWIVGRMRAGVPPAQAQAMADALYHGVREQQIRAVPGLTASQLQVELSGRMALRPLRDGGVGFQFRKPLVILMATVGLLLLIVCTNVANLLLARAAQNQKEIAVRLALGAGRARLAGQCLTEGLVLAGAGAALGFLLAFWVNRTLLHFLVSPDVLNSIDLNPGWPVLLFTASVSVGAAILFSMAPALAAWKLDLNAGLKSAGASQRNLRNVLVTAQISLAVILAVGATLFAGTLAKLHTVDVGFPAENLLLASIDPALNGYTAEQRRSLIAQLEERMAALPGVRAASVAAIATLAGDDYAALFIPEGSDRDYTPNANAVGPGYFETMRIPIVLGRSFSALDHSSSRPVAIINQTLARRAFGGTNPVGKRFRDSNGSGNARVIEIVGVAKDIRYRRPQEKETLDFIYMPYEQSNVLEREIVLHVRSVGDPLKLTRLVEREVHAIDPNLPVFDVKTQEMQVDEMLDRERLIAVLSGLFGVLATLLAASGLYGVMAYSVARRTREIGIRMAVGASASDVIALVLRETARLTAAGILIGLPIAFGLARFAQSLLYEMRADDIRIFVGVSLVLLAVGLTAGLWPARRAARTEPVAALRSE
ncbi:MAG TPA: ABC transporter permease [Bryobacteraceae bacterium]|jgi:predicted permease|nr:ABC transporter permease [Bryobacteraceae bacterium]